MNSSSRNPVRLVRQKDAENSVEEILEVMSRFPALRRLGGKKSLAHSPVHVKLVSAAQMRKLNSSFRAKDRPTDVLSFPAPLIFRKAGILGEIVICLPVLKAQARAFRNTMHQELELLLAHGILHLLGFDHERGSRQAKTMGKWESKILQALHRRQKVRGLIDRLNSGTE